MDAGTIGGNAMRAVIHSANIRGVEPKKNKKGEDYLLVRFEEDGTGKPCTVIDKDMGRKASYVRDAVVDIEIDIDEGRNFTTIRVMDVRNGGGGGG